LRADEGGAQAFGDIICKYEMGTWRTVDSPARRRGMKKGEILWGNLLSWSQV